MVAKKKGHEGEAATGMAKPVKPIPKIDDHSPSSSIIDLQKKLDQIASPTSALSSDGSSLSSNVSIPYAHREYERALRQLE